MLVGTWYTLSTKLCKLRNLKKLCDKGLNFEKYRMRLACYEFLKFNIMEAQHEICCSLNFSKCSLMEADHKFPSICHNTFLKFLMCLRRTTFLKFVMSICPTKFSTCQLVNLYQLIKLFRFIY